MPGRRLHALFLGQVAQFASAMRAAPATEAILFEALRGGASAPRSGGRWSLTAIVDFLARRQKLVVEVDGYHVRRERADARRDRKLGELGYRVLRLPAELVERRLGEAVALVRAALEA